MQYLEEQHIGFDTRICKVPLVVESCIYDLGCGDNVRPDAAMGYAACQAAEKGEALWSGLYDEIRPRRLCRPGR